MCERARHVGCAALLLLLLRVGAAAQDPASEAARLAARADSLAALSERAENAWRALRPQEGSAQLGPLDTMLVGGLRVIAHPDDTAHARAMTERALLVFDGVLLAARDALDSTWLLIEVGGAVDAFDAMRRRPGHTDVWLPRWRSPDRHAALVADRLGAMLADALPHDIQEWMGQRAVPADRATQARQAYRALASSTSAATSECRRGAIARCVEALGLTGADDDPAALDGGVRATLVAQVLERGGVDAWRTLTRDTTGPIAGRLARAAGTDVHSLVADWRAGVIAARPEYRAGLGSSGLVTLVWIAVIAAIAARSTRWRLG